MHLNILYFHKEILILSDLWGDGMKKSLCIFTAVIFISCALCGVAFGSLEEGLVAWYKLDGNAQDSSGNGHDGTVVGATATTDHFGNADRAMAFDGVDDWLTFPDSADFHVQNFSISAWIKPSALSPGFSTIFTKDDWNVGYQLLLGEDSSVKLFIAGNDQWQTNCSKTLSPNLLLNRWTHLVGTCDEKNLKIFMDGQLIADVPRAMAMSAYGSKSLFIGRNVHNAVYLWNGAIDDVRIYNCALSADEVKELYDGGSLTYILIEASRGNGGKISPEGTVKVVSGGNQTFTITPDSGYQIDNVKVDGYTQDAISSYTFDNVSRNHSISASFASAALFGSLKVAITPQGAVDDGAQWRLDGGLWQNSGGTQSGLAVGTHTLEFKNITGWNRPSTQSVSLSAGQSVQKMGTYSTAEPDQGNILGFVTAVNAQGAPLGTLSGATVEVTGQGTCATDDDGRYSLAGIGAGIYTITANKTGYYSVSRTVSLGAGETKSEVFELVQNATGAQPLAVSFDSPSGKHFVPGMPGNLNFKTTIDWKGTPGTVRFFAAGEWYSATITDLGGGQARATVALPAPELISSSAELLLEVINGEGLKTTQGMEVYFHELPGIIFDWFQDNIYWSGSGHTVSHTISMQQKLWDLSFNGAYTSSGEMSYHGTLSFNKDSGTFSGSLGATGVFTHKLEFQGVENIGEGSLGFSGNLGINLIDDQNPPTIIPGWRISAGGKAGIGYPVVRLVQVVFPPASPAIEFLLGVPVVKDLLTALKARFFLLGGMGVAGVYDGGFNLACDLAASNVTLSGTLGVEMQVALEKWGAKVGVYAGGSGTPEAQVCPEWDFLGVVMEAYVGFFAKAWMFQYEREVGSEIRLLSGGDAQTIDSVRLGDPMTTGKWQPIGKSPLKWGGANRLASDSRESPSTTGSTEEKIVENVIELAGPRVFADDALSMILFVLHDTEKPWYAATDIAQVIREGTDPWGMTRVTDDLAAEFSPENTAVDADTLLATWAKVVGDVSGAEGPQDIAPHLEIVVSRCDRTTDIWSDPFQLTDNEQVDRAPMPIVFGGAEGVLWIQNQGQAEIGNATDGDSLLFCAWNGTSWAAPVTLWSAQKGILDFTFVADSGGEGHIVLSVDEDGNSETAEDRNLYRVSSLSGVWQAAVRLTDDSVEDALPVLIAPDDEPMLVFKAGETLKYSPLANWAPVEVYPEYTPYNEAPTLDGVTLPGGAAIAYTAQGEEGINIVAAFYDAALDRWSLPVPLTHDEGVETSLSMAFDGKELVISYLKTQTLREDMEIELNGQVHVVKNVPQPGRTDLYALGHTLGNDLAVKTDSLVFEPGNPAPGTQATIKAAVENRGDLPVQNVLVSFYDGEPNDGGILIGQSTITGPLMAGRSQEVNIAWDVSVDPNARRVFVVVDPDLSFEDRDRSNNKGFAWTVLPDLVMASNRSERLSESTVALTATIGNEGVIPSGAFSVCWRLNAEDGEELGCAEVESIGVGTTREATFPWDSSAYGSPGGTLVVYAVADPGAVLVEINSLNNIGNQGFRTAAASSIVSTTAVSSITAGSASSGGNVTSDGGASVTARGVCWSTSTDPTTADHPVSGGSGTGAFSCKITGLTQNTSYYVRAYATNSAGTAYGENRSFKTLTTVGCPDCSGANPTIHDETFEAGTDCTCTGTSSLTIGPNVVVESGARVTFNSDNIVVKSKVEARAGAYLKMGR